MKKPLLLSFAVIFSLLAAAHEFWLMPQKFFFRLREVASIRFMAGEGLRGENWTGNNARVLQLVHYDPAGKATDISSLLHSQKGDSLQLPLSEEGTHMVIFNSNNAFLSLEPGKFNDYLREEGLDDALAYRRAHNEWNKQSTEHYQRSVKTLLQVSDNTTDACISPTILPLNIIPENNPYTPGVLNGPVRFRVLLNKRPVNNMLVRTWYREGGDIHSDTARTNRRGWVSARRHNGYFMVSCVYMQHTVNDAEADWQSYWASISFEYPRFAGSRSRAGNP